ncbi:hypothetical protein [Ruegeria arenilitoris]|uniref:Uncharacterized protein n=1 Tax=Ruegeria arenilitoris TaxID=1173585 RepID=A0A238JZ22_9RHOB|nr:hypothetical protein [Ruegeria arenilitoris]SMX35889.1 hypothetical protein RUA8715_01215 [Ruegeria arenilitoris]
MHVAIHSGVVFSDGGLLLKSLQANAKVLQENGIVLFGPRRFRKAFKTPLNALDEGKLTPDACERLKAQIPDDPETGRVVMSTADFIGELNSAIKDGQFYPYAGRRLALLDQAFEGHEVELFIGLQNPGSFIPKVLMALPDETRESILASTDLSCLSWLTLIEDIHDLAPAVSITVWANEECPLIWGDIIRSLCGLSADIPLTEEFSLLSSLVDADGKREIEEIQQQVGHADPTLLHERLAAVFSQHALPERVEEELDFPGWSAEIHEAFSELYTQDLERLKKLPGVRFLGR